jgi:hypothetical protein
MVKEATTKPRSVDLRKLSDPRTWKKQYMKHVFRGNKDAYEDFVRYYDDAVRNGNVYAVDMAWVEFNKVWFVDEHGEYVRVGE